MYIVMNMHRDIKNDIIKSLPFTFSKVGLSTYDGREQKEKIKQINSNDALSHILDHTENGNTDKSSHTDRNNSPEGIDNFNCCKSLVGERGKGNGRERKEASNDSHFNGQVNSKHVLVRNTQKKNSAKKWPAKPRKQYDLSTHTRGRDTIRNFEKLLSMSGMEKDRKGIVGRGDNDEELNYYPDGFDERAYVTVEKSKVNNWRMRNYLNVDKLSLSVSTSSMGEKVAEDQHGLSSGGDDFSSDAESPARRVSGQGNNIFGESLFSSFNLNFDPLEGVSDNLGVHLAEGFPTDVDFNAGVKGGPSRTDSDHTVTNLSLEVDNTMHSLDEDKELHLFDSLKNLYKNHNKKIKLINYNKILNTSLCKRMQDVAESQHGKVLEVNSRCSGRNGRKDRSSGEDRGLGEKITEHDVKTIIMNIKKRLGFYSGEEREEGQVGTQVGTQVKTQVGTRRDKRCHIELSNRGNFCESLNYSRDEVLSDSVENELRNGEEPNRFAKVDAARQIAEKRIHKGESPNLLNYKSFVSDDFNFPNDRDDALLGLSTSHNSQRETLPSSSKGCPSTDNEDVFALSMSSAQFKRSFLRATGRGSSGVDGNEGKDGGTGPHEKDQAYQSDDQSDDQSNDKCGDRREDQPDEQPNDQQDDGAHTDCDSNPSMDLSHLDTQANKRKETNRQEVLKREEFPTEAEANCCRSVSPSGESSLEERILDGEGGCHSKNIFYINEDIKKEKIKKLTSGREKYDEDMDTCTDESPKDFSTEGKEQFTCNGNNSKREGVDILSQEMNNYMFDIFENQVKHLNELVANTLS
ncbi:conserved Plasmodium protein, unknown function [Plasmodium knowlesi strain H]|uniref:Uncharacterized protein n=3 Tax=Plasmodium knowlesi TaxID=5850 RepID=A0A5K1VLL5_PLAKH|nr:conserved Plasmodium protein, unknown function [Plasmodium knowlesi strain H]OTN67819.1 Uncharacterized protein PKNOH_S05377500 [Plasmodium knowlesi]CAA9990365.1 conserved Plasmodium protein, unknown function [Plasmodium knowlesi strain H]SBO19571.1 conserved Plasmodium protein, unknown function [Plasmodium knowlesi strain H]SBO22691.1 conserved Plasmodium protein, unknown function [Plasmodium knowlesi strain H]VVS79839.1 conserved Plasmodium protein, unknown function [Plasmodium knowlesi s|eukprot:XP_002260765.1 hypothetical protein, conserved in Plasmodium species [Plasmodium knowlesi strain H]